MRSFKLNGVPTNEAPDPEHFADKRNRKLFSNAGDDFVASFGLETLGKSLRELGVSGEGAKMVLVAAVRMFDTVLLVRNLAAKQCAEVRAELAAAVARLSSRAAVVSEARGIARKASTCNSTLLMRLVDLELRWWHALRKGEQAKTADKSSAATEQGADEGGAYPSNSPVASPIEEVRGSTMAFATSTNRNQEDSDHDDGKRERISRLRRRLGEVKRTRWHSPPLTTAVGATLDLSSLGLTDEALNLVVQMLLRRCTHQPKITPAKGNARDKGANTAGSIQSPPKSPEEAGAAERQLDKGLDDRRAALLFPAGGEDRRRVIVPLSRLILRGNCLTNAGAVALAPLVQASHSLVEIDLRSNSIGKKGKLTLKKALMSNPWVHSVTSEDACNSESNRGRIKRGVVLRARRRPRTTSEDRAKAYAFAIIPPLLQPGRASPTPTPPTTATAGKLTERFTDSRGTCRASSNGKLETSCNVDDRAPAHGDSTNGLGSNLRLMGDAVMDGCGENTTAIAASLKIDLRGCCSRQPFPFGVIAEESVPLSRTGLLQATPSVGLGESLTPAGRRRRQRRADVSRSRRRRSIPALEGVQHSPSGDRLADNSSSIGSVTAMQLQRQRRSQRPDGVQTRDDCRHPAKSERQDADDLKSLLSASRLIFDEIERHCEQVTPDVAEDRARPYMVDGVDLPRKPVGTVHTQHRAEIRSTINPYAEGTLSSSEVRARCHESDSRGSFQRRRLTDKSGSQIVGTAHCGENHQSGLSEPQQNGRKMLLRVGNGDQNSRSDLGGRLTLPSPDELPTLATVAASDACLSVAGEGNKPDTIRANGSRHRPIDAALPVDKRGADGIGQATLQPSITDVGDARIAAVTTGSTANTPAVWEAGTTAHSYVSELGVAAFPARLGLAEGHADSPSGNSPGIDSPVEAGADLGYHSLNRRPNKQATCQSKPSYDGGGGTNGGVGGDDGGDARHTISESNAPPPVETLAEGVHGGYSHENYSNSGWVYDEASGSWMFDTNYAAALSEAHDAGDANDRWRYDEHRAAWYHEEPATDGPQTSDVPDQNQEVSQQQVALKTITGGSRGTMASTVARVGRDSVNTAAAGKWGGGARRQGSRNKPKKTRVGVASRALLFRSRAEDAENMRASQDTSDDDGDDEAGGIVAERIKALQDVLEAK